MRVLVTHPGRQHSHQMALALAGSGILAGYWAGVPAVAEQARRLPEVLRRQFARYAPVPLDPGQVRWFPWTPGIRRLGETVLPPPAAAWTDLFACRLFDRWAASRLAGESSGPGGRIDAVIACEVSAAAIFQAARGRGIATILDAPSLHHRAQDRLHGATDPAAVHRRVTRIKDREIALADHVLTVSELARETYLDAGLPAERVHALPLGADLDLFSPGDGPGPSPAALRTPMETPEAPGRAAGAGGAGGEFRFLFAGATIRRKGFDLLLAAFDQVARAEPAARLRIVGPRGDAAALLDGRAESGAGGGISVSGAVPQAELAAELRRADCLVLPSRNDSFGMVVAEALSAGLPVIVSDMVGAKDLVRSGENGWVVPFEDAAALAARMLWCVRHPEQVRAMRPACRRSAAAATWPAYHRRCVELIQAIGAARSAG